MVCVLGSSLIYLKAEYRKTLAWHFLSSKTQINQKGLNPNRDGGMAAALGLKARIFFRGSSPNRNAPLFRWMKQERSVDQGTPDTCPLIIPEI